MWQITGKYGPYAWSRTCQSIYIVLSRTLMLRDRILEFGSSTGHISFRIAKEGYNVNLLDVRAEPINEARQIFSKNKVNARFFSSKLSETWRKLRSALE
ncbi:hypothetical protein OR1_03850 [Geobacter sp. OR-1]|nr:hypothetical protein OR1_03850 [Geobacter sp. OR-1]